MDPSEVGEMILSGNTHREISEEFTRRYPAAKGLSERSVRRFCQEHSFHKPRGEDLNAIVRVSVQEVLYVRRRAYMRIHVGGAKN